MNVIATVGTNKFLCEVTFAELKGIDPNITSSERVAIGQVIEIKKLLATAAFLKNVDKSKLQTAAETLTDALEGLINARDYVQALTLFETLADENLA